jgi:uncharacterized protein (DUF58 family)
VNWKASARSEGLVVNQRVHESMTRVTFLVDARAVAEAGPADASPLAVAARIVAGLAETALRSRDRVRIVAYGPGVIEAQDVPGADRMEEVRTFLARLEAGGSMGAQAAVSAIASTLRPNGPVVVCSGLEADDGFVDALRTLRARNVNPVVVAPPLGTRPRHADEGGPEPDEQRIAAERARIVEEIRAMGVPLFEPRDDVPLDLLLRLGVGAR